jgi:hypothetical protein
MESREKVLAGFVGEHRIMEVDFWQPWNSAENNILDTGLAGRGDRYGIAAAAEACRTLFLRRKPAKVCVAYDPIIFRGSDNTGID